MRDIWFISDTHLNHANILTFRGLDGELIRPDFDDVEHMNEAIIENWNACIKPGDKVYHLGDVLFGPPDEGDELLGKLNGQKRLILGNHDDWKKYGKILSKHFKKIMMGRQFKEFNFLATHIPAHSSNLYKVAVNVHGHIHEKDPPPGPYYNISVERTNYAPLHIEEVYEAVVDIIKNYKNEVKL